MPSPAEEACLRACHECVVACLRCATACLKEPDPKAMARCIALDLECADICQLAVTSMARGDGSMNAICTLCVQACSRCAAECGQHDMDHCQHCAEACKRCADACAEMSN